MAFRLTDGSALVTDSAAGNLTATYSAHSKPRSLLCAALFRDLA